MFFLYMFLIIFIVLLQIKEIYIRICFYCLTAFMQLFNNIGNLIIQYLVNIESRNL